MRKKAKRTNYLHYSRLIRIFGLELMNFPTVKLLNSNMHKMISRTVLITVIALVAAVALPRTASAQGRIDKMVEYLEKRHDVNVTFTEKRSEKKKKLYKVSRVITFSNTDYVPRIRAAFEAERDKAVSAVKDDSDNLVFKFADKQGTSSYVLTYAYGTYTLVQTWESRKIKPTSAVAPDGSGDMIERQVDAAVARAYAAQVRQEASVVRACASYNCAMR